MPKHHKQHPKSQKPHQSSKTRGHVAQSNNQKNPTKIWGVIAITGKGTGYVSGESFKDSVEIPPEALNGAFPKDMVEVDVLRAPTAGGQAQGRVSKVISRSREQFVGTIRKTEGKLFLAPDNSKIPYPIIITDAPDDAIAPDKKVLVSVSKWSDGSRPVEAHFEEIIGTAGEHETEIQSIVLGRGFSLHFPESVLAAAARVKTQWSNEAAWAEEVSHRLDLRDTFTMTIDPWNAKDFDDALSFKELPNGEFEIGIHIADVSHFVEKGSALDKEARRRATSVYLVDRTIPMLPEVLSNDLCSLNPGEEKFAFSAILTLKRDGTVTDKRFTKSVIKSDKRFTYEEAQEAIENTNDPHHKQLAILNDIAKIIKEKRFQKGAIDFETNEFEFVLDENKKPIKIIRKVRKDSHKLVEEYMLLANRSVAEFMYKINEAKNKKLSGQAMAHFIYRIHDLPNPEKVANLSIFLKALGYEFEMDEHQDISSKDIQRLLQMIEGTPIEQLIKTAAVRTMSKAVYSTKNIGHFGLSFEYYTHFTSPIRRYPDLAVHRLLFRELKNQKIEANEFELWQNIADQSTTQEILAAEAERESVKFKQVEYMAQHIGETYDGVISGVTDFGMYIEDVKTGCEGMVMLRNLGNDYFEFNDKTYSISGRRTRQKYTLGDKVKFKVIGADPLKRQLDYQIVQE